MGSVLYPLCLAHQNAIVSLSEYHLNPKLFFSFYCLQCCFIFYFCSIIDENKILNKINIDHHICNDNHNDSKIDNYNDNNDHNNDNKKNKKYNDDVERLGLGLVGHLAIVSPVSLRTF